MPKSSTPNSPALELYLSVDEAIALEAALAEFNRITVGASPEDDVLGAAPYLGAWRRSLVPTIEPVLIGTVEGHPCLPGRRQIVTSRLVALDAAAGWARTVNRYYRLGRPVE